jgi:hypothetical protein
MTSLGRKTFKHFFKTMDAYQTHLAAEGVSVPPALSDAYLRTPMDDAQQRVLVCRYLEDWSACLNKAGKNLRPLAAKAAKCLQDAKQSQLAHGVSTAVGADSTPSLALSSEASLVVSLAPSGGSPCSSVPACAPPVQLLREVTLAAMCTFVSQVTVSEVACLYEVITGSACFRLPRQHDTLTCAVLLKCLALGAAAADATTAPSLHTAVKWHSVKAVFDAGYWRQAKDASHRKKAHSMVLAGFAAVVAAKLIDIAAAEGSGGHGGKNGCVCGGGGGGRGGRPGTPMYRIDDDGCDGDCVCDCACDDDEDDDECAVADNQGFRMLAECVGSLSGSVLSVLANADDASMRERALDNLLWTTTAFVTSGALKSNSMARFLYQVQNVVWPGRYTDVYVVSLPRSAQVAMYRDIKRLAVAAALRRAEVPCMWRTHDVLHTALCMK